MRQSLRPCGQIGGVPVAGRAALQAPPASHHAPHQRIEAQIGGNERGRTFLHAVPASPVDRIAEGQSRPVRRFAEPVGEADEKSVEPGGPDLRPEGVGVGHRISAGRYRACRQSVGRQRALQPRSVGWVSNPPYLRAGGAHEMKTPPGFRRGAFLCRPIGPDQATRSRGARPSKKSIRFSKRGSPSPRASPAWRSPDAAASRGCRHPSDPGE